MTRSAATDPLAGGVRAPLVAGSLGTAALQVVARGLGFATTLVLAALMGASGYGAYAWSVAWMLVLAVPAALGRDRLLMREMAGLGARREWGLLRGVLHDSLRVVAAAALTLAGIGTVVALAIDASAPSRLVAALAVAFVLLPLLTLSAVVQGALQGLHRVVTAQVPDSILRPLVFLALVGGAAVASGGRLTAQAALVMQALAAAAALAVTAWLLRTRLRVAARPAAPEYDSARWRRSGLTMATGAALGVLGARIDLILVGIVLGAADAGAYGVAVAAASVAALPYTAIARPLNPVVARLHAVGDSDRLARAVTGATRATFVATLAVGGALALAGNFGLGLLGDAFTHAAGALALLCLAAVVNAAFAANALALVMTGHERDATRAAAIGVAAAVALNAALIPALGLAGAATATVLSVLVRNALASRYAWTRLGLDTTLVGKRRNVVAPTPLEHTP